MSEKLDLDGLYLHCWKGHEFVETGDEIDEQLHGFIYEAITRQDPVILPLVVPYIIAQVPVRCCEVSNKLFEIFVSRGVFVRLHGPVPPPAKALTHEAPRGVQ